MDPWIHAHWCLLYSPSANDYQASTEQVTIPWDVGCPTLIGVFAAAFSERRVVTMLVFATQSTINEHFQVLLGSTQFIDSLVTVSLAIYRMCSFHQSILCLEHYYHHFCNFYSVISRDNWRIWGRPFNSQHCCCYTFYRHRTMEGRVKLTSGKLDTTVHSFIREPVHSVNE